VIFVVPFVAWEFPAWNQDRKKSVTIGYGQAERWRLRRIRLADTKQRDLARFLDVVSLQAGGYNVITGMDRDAPLVTLAELDRLRLCTPCPTGRTCEMFVSLARNLDGTPWGDEDNPVRLKMVATFDEAPAPPARQLDRGRSR
jgi:hypothetical protein